MLDALNFLNEEIQRLENAPKINGCEMTDDWKKQIEICRNMKSAVEKQIPKKLIIIGRKHDEIGGLCPTCDGCVTVKQSFMKQHKGCHCDWCGQKLDYDAIDWSGENG